jgi:hypothetical protein
MSCFTSGTDLTPHPSKPDASKVCLLEATPGISSWLSKAWTTASYGDVTDMRESIDNRNNELRAALGLGTTGGSTNQIFLEAFYYYDDKSLNTNSDFRSWENPSTVFPLFNVDNPDDIDARWPDCATKQGTYRCKDPFVGNQREQDSARHNDPHGTRNGWTLSSHADLKYLRDSNKKEFPHGCRKNSSLYKIQGFYGITIACDRTHVATQLAKAIVINQVAYTNTKWDTEDPIPFTRMVFMFIVGEYEREAMAGGSYKYRMCTAWRDYLMQEIVFLDFCFNSRDHLWYLLLRKFFNHVSTWNECDDSKWLVHLANAPPKIWTETLRKKQARLYASQKLLLTDVQKWEIAKLVATQIFRIPPFLVPYFLPDTRINSGDKVWFVLNWPTCPRLIMDGGWFVDGFRHMAKFEPTKRTQDEDASKIRNIYHTITSTAGAGIRTNTSVTLTNVCTNPQYVTSFALTLKKTSKIGSVSLASAPLSSGMPVTLANAAGNYFLAHQGISVSAGGALVPLTLPNRSSLTPAFDDLNYIYKFKPSTDASQMWIVYKDPGDTPRTTAPSSTDGQPMSTGSATSLSSAVTAVEPLSSAATPLGTGAAGAAAPLSSAVAPVAPLGTAPSASSFVADSTDWAYGYALTASAVAAVSLFSLDAVSYFGDKETGTSKPIASDATETVYRGDRLSSLVASAVAYDAVDAPTLFGSLKRPSNVDAAAQAHLGVVAVAASAEITLTCLSCSPRVAKELATRPSAASLDGASFLQMQLLTDFTSSYFLRANKTKRGTLICRAFRLVPYNVCAILLLVAVVVMLVSEGSPATRRIRRVRTAARAP